MEFMRTLLMDLGYSRVTQVKQIQALTLQGQQDVANWLMEPSYILRVRITRIEEVNYDYGYLITIWSDVKLEV